MPRSSRTLTVVLAGNAKGALGALDKTDSRMKKFAKSAALAAGVAATALAVLGTKGVASAIELEKGLAEVRTLLPQLSDKGFKVLQQDVLDFSDAMGVATTQVVPALYQAISAGVPQQNVFAFMEIASKAAIGGVTTLETAVDGVTSVINAYGREAITAQRASDLMFTAVRLGKTNFEQLSASLFNVVPSAVTAGVKFEEVAAVLARLTAQGTPTSVATTQLRQAILALVAPSAKTAKTMKDMGLEFDKAKLAQVGLAGAFQQVIDAADGDLQVLRRLLGSTDALQAVLGITGQNAAAFADALAQMEGAAGATNKAFETMDQSLSRKWERTQVRLTNMLTRFGVLVLPHVARAGLWLADVVEYRLAPALADAAKTLRDFTVPWIDRMRDVVNEVIPFVRDLGVVLGLLEGDEDAELHPFIQWLEDNKETIKTIGTLAVGVLAAWLAFKGILAIILTVSVIVAKAKLAWAALSLVFGAVSLPVLLIAVAIALLAGWLALLISSGGDAGLAMEKLGNVVGPALTKIREALGKLVSWVTGQLTDTENWKKLGGALIAAWGAAVDFLGWAKTAMAKLGMWLVGQLTDTDNWKKLGEALIGAFGPVLDFVVWAVKGMDALVAWVIGEAVKLDNWKALGTALITAFVAAFLFVGLVKGAFAKLVVWVIGEALNTENWKALGSALVAAFGAALDFWAWATTKWAQLKLWVGTKIVEVVSASQTWAALGEAVAGAISGGMDLLGGLKTKWQSMIDGIPDLITKLRTAIADLWTDMIPYIPVPGLGAAAAVGGAVKSLIPGFARGGIVPATPGGRVVRVAEGGRAEAIVPLGPGGGLGGTPVINLYIDATGGDPNRIADVLLPALQRLYARGSLEQFSISGG